MASGRVPKTLNTRKDVIPLLTPVSGGLCLAAEGYGTSSRLRAVRSAEQ